MLMLRGTTKGIRRAIALIAWLLLADAPAAQSIVDPSGLDHRLPIPTNRTASEIERIGQNLFARYEAGRQLIQRTFRFDEGAMTEPGIPPDGGDGLPSVMKAHHTRSCASCHGIPFGDPGAGGTVKAVGPNGRNTPHFFGGGLVQQVGEWITRSLYLQCDRNGDGVIGFDEVARSCRVNIETGAGGSLAFGDASLDENGKPRLNPVFRVTYVSADGSQVRLPSEGAVGYTALANVFGWGLGTQRLTATLDRNLGGDTGSLREFFERAARLHIGMERRKVDGGKGLGTADLDAADFYMRHMPPPAQLTGPTQTGGKAVFAEIGCASCHQPDWKLPARSKKLQWPGDERYFRLLPHAVVDGDGKMMTLLSLTPPLEKLAQHNPEPLGGEVIIEGVYSDFRHWDIGPAFHETRYDGGVIRSHRTAPLWGVGSSAPYSHSGQFSDLDAVVSSHAGSALAASRNYRNLPSDKKEALISFLKGLTLYSTRYAFADLNGNKRFGEAQFWDPIVNLPEVFDAALITDPSMIGRIAGVVEGPSGNPLPLFSTHDFGTERDDQPLYQ